MAQAPRPIGVIFKSVLPSCRVCIFLPFLGYTKSRQPQDIGRATTRTHLCPDARRVACIGGHKTSDGRPQGSTTPHPLPARPYNTTNRPAKPVYSRGLQNHG